MSAFLLPASCRCPQRSMLSHFAIPPVSAASRTRTRVTTTFSRSWSMLVSQPDESFLLNANTGRSGSKVFAPLYQTDVPLPSEYRYQLPYNAPPVPKPSPDYLPQAHPSHQQRWKRQPSLKHASYASRTIPLMMTPAPQPNPHKLQLDRAFLDMAKQRLEENKHFVSHHFDDCTEQLPLREAAVLMPLCIVKGVPSVLFTVRSTKLRSHRGECSFPGGKRDPTDVDCLETALREMEEEVFISPKDIEILGEYTPMPMPNRNCTMRVQPYVGFIRTPIDDISSIRFNPDEVQKVFTIPLEDLVNPEKNKNLARFRESKYVYPVWHVEEEGCTVWGMTAFIMDGVLRRIMKRGPMGALVCPEGVDIPRYRAPILPEAPVVEAVAQEST